MNCPRCGNEVPGGKKFCPSCGGKMDDALAKRQAAPQTDGPRPAFPASTPADGRLTHDKYLFNQKIFALRPTYFVFDENLSCLFYIRRILFALKRHIYIYNDEAFSNIAYTLFQDNIVVFLYKWFTLVDAKGEVLARFRRRNIISILRRTWDIFDANGNKTGAAVEDSWGKALFRRFGPLGGYFKTDFIITLGDRRIGKFIRRLTLEDKYILDLTGDPGHDFDRRAAIALGVLLDTAEAR
jgi:hypothetical protein